ncbi:MAG TPA: hypothetical protein PKD24_12410 [Pyrinomonadaceae bacterium]|nr:hypothetical protein [Pyrinomonadaceae bacterium]HMP66390.1 hypothetical protein [Pyrinomonadaceae bacterium]
MKNRLLVLVFGLIAGLGSATDDHVSGQNRTVRAEAERISGDRFTISTRTPRGARIYAVNRPSGPMLNAIDKGLTELFAVARKHGYNRRLSFSDYSIYIARADRTEDSKGNYSPDIAVGAAQYAGTDYDQGGYIYAAGMVIAFNPMAFVIAEHTREMNRVSDVVRFEGEHLVLYHNDRRRFNETADHSKGGGHPILQYMGARLPDIVCGIYDIVCTATRLSPQQADFVRKNRVLNGRAGLQGFWHGRC